VLESLARCQPGAAAKFAPSIVQLLSRPGEDSARVRSWAAAVLDAIGPDCLQTPGAIESLANANSSDPSWQVRHNALSALGSAEAPYEVLLSACRRGLHEPELTTRLIALRIIRPRRELVRSLKPEIRAALADPAPEVRDVAAEILGTRITD
jgi:hypothetical protein